MIDLGVRGKRKRKRKPPSPRAADSINSAEPRRSGRPMMSASALARNKRSEMAPAATQQAQMQSRLEKLPVELIEQIFLHSLEINMARASPFLSKTLSKESIYRPLILFSFFDDNDQRHPLEENLFEPAVYRPLEFDERVRLQQVVLECRWCTISRIRQCIPNLARLAIVQQWHENRASEATHGEGNSEPREYPSLPPLDDPETLNPSELPCFAGSRDISGTKYQTHIYINGYVRNVLNNHYFPKRLLNPQTWKTREHSQHSDEDPFDFLELLYYSLPDGMPRLLGEAKQTHDPTTLHHGLETAIRERCDRAVWWLLFIRKTNIPARQKTPQDQPPEELCPPLPTHLFHLATQQENHSTSLLRVFFNHAKESIPKDDSALTKWALARPQRERKNSPPAFWSEDSSDALDSQTESRGKLRRTFAAKLLDWMQGA
jgi:hypothetical protein